MDKYLTIADFPNSSYLMALIYSVSSAVPLFFPLFVFFLWLLGSSASYFIILERTNKKRFFHVITASSFTCFLLSLLFSSMNGPVVVMNGYWIMFYALMTGLSYLGLEFYK